MLHPPLRALGRLAATALPLLACAAGAHAQTLAVTSRTTGRVVHIDLATLEVVRTFETGASPHELAGLPGAAVVWTPSYEGRGVTEIDLLTGATRTLAAEAAVLHGVAVAPGAERLWVTSETDSTLLEVDPVTGSVVRRIRHGLGSGHMVAASPDGAVLWVPDLHGGGVARIDAATGRIRVIPLGRAAEGIEVSPDGSETWVTLVPSGEIVVLDRTGAQVARFPSGGAAPVKLRMQPGGARVWVSNNSSGVVSVFDRVQRARLADIAVGTRPLGIGFDETGRRAWVTRPGGANEIVEIDTESFEVLRRFPGPPSPDGVVWIPPHPVPDSAVQFPLDSGVELFGDLYRHGEGPPHAMLLLLHQGGGSGRAEYRNIVPRLLAARFDVLTVDLPGGGDRFGGFNRTVRASDRPWTGYCGDYEYADAAVDQALALARGARVLVVGSSYTGALALQLAGRRTGDLLGVAAFSPAGGEPLAACPGPRYTEGVSLPILVVRPETEAERPSVEEDLATLARQGHQTWIARPGTHGASTLDPSRAARAEETWRVFDEWLRKVVPP